MTKGWKYDPNRFPDKPEPKFAMVKLRHCDNEGYKCRDCGKPRGWPHDHRCRWDFANMQEAEEAAERAYRFAGKVEALRARLAQ